jgi:hypothetical protein
MADKIQRSAAHVVGASFTGVTAAGTRAFGPTAMGPLAIAVSAVGAIAIGRVAIANAVIRKLKRSPGGGGRRRARERFARDAEFFHACDELTLHDGSIDSNTQYRGGMK